MWSSFSFLFFFSNLIRVTTRFVMSGENFYWLENWDWMSRVGQILFCLVSQLKDFFFCSNKNGCIVAFTQREMPQLGQYNVNSPDTVSLNSHVRACAHKRKNQRENSESARKVTAWTVRRMTSRHEMYIFYFLCSLLQFSTFDARLFSSIFFILSTGNSTCMIVDTQIFGWCGWKEQPSGLS